MKDRKTSYGAVCVKIQADVPAARR